MNGRPWTRTEHVIVRALELAGYTPAAMLAHLPGRSLSAVYQVRVDLGLARHAKTLLGGLNDLIRERHAQQWCDGEIAADWNGRQIAAAAKIDRSCVSARRRKLGLPNNRFAQRAREQVAVRTRRQLAAAGLPSLNALQKRAVRDRIKAMGWPEDLSEREAQVLTYIWEHGPMTKREICAGIGMKVHAQSRKMLKSNGPGGNYLADLMRRGLLIRLGRVAKTGPGKGQCVQIYSLAFTIERRKVQSNVGETERPDQGPGERDRGIGAGLGAVAAVAAVAASGDEQLDQAGRPEGRHVGPDGEGQERRHPRGQLRHAAGAQDAAGRDVAVNHDRAA